MKKVFVVIGIIVVIICLFLFFVGRTKNKSVSLQDKLNEVSLKVKNGDFNKAEEMYADMIREYKDSEDVILSKEGLADLFRMQNQLLKAKNLYKQIINQYPESERIQNIQRKLWNLNKDILFSGLITKNSTVYVVKPHDTLDKIAKRFKTTVALIKQSNGLNSDIIRPGDRLKVVTANFSIVVDKSQNTLALKENGEVVKIYTVATGKDNSTPVGEFTIVNKIKNPVWYKTGAILPPESPENVLGDYWMGLSIKGYGIHGTTQPETLGKQITKGCIRMNDKDIKELFIIVPRGTKVTIVD